MLDETLRRIEDLVNSGVSLVPGLLVGLVVFSIGLLIARGVRAAVTRAAMLRDTSAVSAAVLGRIASGTARLLAFLIAAWIAFPSVSAGPLHLTTPAAIGMFLATPPSGARYDCARRWDLGIVLDCPVPVRWMGMCA
jgi:hypothetical protein